MPAFCFAVAIASAYNLAWGVPARVSRERLVGLSWLAGGAILLVVGSFVTAGFGALPAGAPFRGALPVAVAARVFLPASFALEGDRLRDDVI